MSMAEGIDDVLDHYGNDLTYLPEMVMNMNTSILFSGI